MRQIHTTILVFILSIILVFPAIVGAQTPTPADQHDQHHPQTVEATPSTSVASTPTPDKKMTDSNSAPMTSGMGEMMNRMGNPPQKELYPSLMELPADLPSEKRAEIQRLAQERINKGNFLLKQAGEKMSNPATTQNPAAMQEALAQMRQGLTLLESGLAAQRTLAENQNPREAAVKWFKLEMNLSPGAAEVEQPHGFFGLSWFHYVSMLTLAAFSGAMIWIYFQRMKRAGALAARLANGSVYEVPLPGASTPDPLPRTSVAAPVAVNLDIAPSKSNSWSGVLLVSKIFDEAPQVKTFRLTDPSGGKLPFNYLPGQFVTITVAPGGVTVKRSYTISSSPTRRDYCEITVKRETRGTVSHYLHERVHEGELLQLTGPSGKFTFTGEETDGIVLIAGGVGVTPLMSVVRYLTDRSWKGDIFFFFGCKTESDIIYREEIEYLEKRHPNLRVWIILEEPPEDSQNSYFAGRVTKEILEERVPEIASRRVHICGPPPMIEAVKQMLDELRVPKENVHTEIFAGKLPAPKAAALAPENAGKTAIATFARSRKTAVLTPDKTILEASEEAGVNIDYSCRVGTCGICKTKLLSGKVTMDVEEALTDEDRADNIILACQAKATEDVAVDA